MANHPNRYREPPRAATLAAVLARALPDATPHRIGLAVGAMIHAAKAHKRVGEQRCNYNFTEAEETRQDKRLGRLENKAYSLLTVCGGEPAGAYGVLHAPTGRTVHLAFGGDPRGCCGQLIVSDMPGDGWGEGFAIHD